MTAALIHQRRWKTLRVLALSLVIIGLDNTILNVALPSLQEHFDASSSTLQWMVDSYLVSFAGLLLTLGMLGDRFGRKRALQTGIALFGRASLAVLFVETSDAAHRRPRRDGHRRRADHAGDAVDHHQRLPARGARARRSASGPAWPRSASASARCSAACCSSSSTGARCSSSTCPSRSSPSRSGSATCPNPRPPPGPLRPPGARALDRPPWWRSSTASSRRRSAAGRTR